MRTTVTIDDELLRRAKESAARRGQTLGDVVDDALRLALDATSRQSVPVTVPRVYGGSGLQPGVDLEDKDALTALLEAEDGHARAAG